MSHLGNLEDLIFQWMLTLPETEQKSLWNGYDVINSMPEDAQEEIKNEIFTQMIDDVNYIKLIKRLKEYLSERAIETPTQSETNSSEEE